MTCTPRRLTVVHTEASCGWGGQELRILSEAQGMLQRGHRVHLLCPPEAPIHAQAVKIGIPVTPLPIARLTATGVLALRRWLAAHPQTDVLNTHSSTDSWLAALACATLRRSPPIVRTRHVSTRIRNNWPTRWLYQRATRYIVTTGEALREQLVRENGFDAARISSVPTGVDLERFCPRDPAGARGALGLDPARHYLGIVATLRNWKGHTYLLEAFAALATSFPDWQLLIVGDGPQRHNLARRIGELGLGDRVHMAGNRQDVERWFNALDIFVLPSYGEEGMSQSVMQAMASALPVVTTTVGAIPEAVINDRTGILVPPHNTRALAEALERLMGDESLRRRLGEAGRARAQERFGLDRMLDAMEAVFFKASRACAG